jgi:hypothetical protein
MLAGMKGGAETCGTAADDDKIELDHGWRGQE